MRLFLVVLATCGCLLVCPAVGQEPSFPYKAFITTDEVYVRSGPGQTYYPTEKLKAGQEVEVYRHDPGGWYAIRPPEKSFSWVSSRYLGAGQDDLAVVAADRVAARVGSRFSDIRDVIQVRLHKGEVVHVLDTKKIADRSGANVTWYKIAPPSGEFRWVFGKYVDPDYPKDGIRKPHAAENRAARAPDGIAKADAPRDDRSQEPPAFVQQDLGTETIERTSYDAGDPTEYEDASAQPRDLTPEAFQAELEEINLELAIMVAEEPTVWSFDALRRRANSLLAEAQTAVERGRARNLLSKMDRFAELKHRNDTVLAARANAEKTNRRLAQLRAPQGNAAAQSQTPESRFDGSGQLIRVVSTNLGAPRYALVDDRGEVRCYVSPSPGVYLRHYLGRWIGVNGTRGYMPEQRAHHVMARHVSPLEGQLR